MLSVLKLTPKRIVVIVSNESDIDVIKGRYGTLFTRVVIEGEDKPRLVLG